LFTDQGEDVRFKSCAVLSRMTEQQFNEPPLAGPEMPVDPPAGEPMQEGHRLLGEQFFEFVACHVLAVSSRHSAVS
jgi:hypothetical protein